MPTLLYLTPRDQGRPLTLEEFEHACGQEGSHYELIDGRLEVSPSPNWPHEILRKWLERALDRYVERHPEIINYVQSPARVFVPGRRRPTAPEPDLAAYRDLPLALPIDQINWQDHSPLLVAEILSVDTANKDLRRNLQLYLQVPSIREYWIIDPRINSDTPSLTVHRRRGRRWQNPIEIAAGETYTTRLLPEFSLVLNPRQ
jgi:Uma2 family endonuclease